MKKINLLSLLILLFIALISCEESTVNEPNDDDSSKNMISLLTKKEWTLQSITPPVGYWIPKYKFNENYTFVAFHNNEWVNGTWDINTVETLPEKYILGLKFDKSTNLGDVKCYINYLKNDTLHLSTVEFNDVIANYIKL